MLGKKELEAIVRRSYDKCGNHDTVEFLDRLKDLGFEHAFKSGLSIYDELFPENVLFYSLGDILST